MFHLYCSCSLGRGGGTAVGDTTNWGLCTVFGFFIFTKHPGCYFPYLYPSDLKSRLKCYWSRISDISLANHGKHSLCLASFIIQGDQVLVMVLQKSTAVLYKALFRITFRKAEYTWHKSTGSTECSGFVFIYTSFPYVRGTNSTVSPGGEDPHWLIYSWLTAPALDLDGSYPRVLLPGKYACQSILWAHMAIAAASFLSTYAHLHLRIFPTSKIRDMTCSSS